MKQKTIEGIQEEYDLELDKVVKEIKKKRAKIVLLQFPDGLKPWATTIVDYLEQKTNKVEFIIWLGSCYGACDTPVGLDDLKPKIDLVVQFGHNEMMPGY
ncbi:2-(3-amino-3-carboxypropyl)histidine synthase [uncultured archaeon]|nr:2-(3-amino-3-carboxypropyl)histidine synthase [uncultured archaeon]